MSESLVKTNNVLAVWENLNDVRAQFGPTLTDKEFAFFVTLGKSFGANPFLREIWAVKYDAKSPASIFLGRDMYRKKAQEIPEYNGHLAEAIYEKDNFSVENGIPKHSYSSFGNRGKLLGAYYLGWSKKAEHPFYVSVRFEEYNQGFALWKSKPETQIKKVAEAQGLRGQYQGVYKGTYDESEQWAVENKVNPKANVIPPPATQAKVEPMPDEPKYHPTEKEIEEIHEEERQQAEPTEPPSESNMLNFDENSIDGLRNKIRDEAASAFPNPPSFSLWLKTLTSNEEKGFRGIESVDQSKSIPQLRFILGSLRKKVADSGK